MKSIIKYLLVCLAMMATTSGAFAEVEVDYEGSFTANFGKGDLAPYYIRIGVAPSPSNMGHW